MKDRKNRQKNYKNRDDHRQKGQVAKKSRLNINVFGTHAVAAAWNNPARHIHALYITENALKDFEISSDAKRPQPTIVSKDDLDRALPQGTVHQGIALSCQSLDEVSVQDLIIKYDNDEKSLLVMLDQVTDPHNVGAILRSACAFGAKGMIMQRKHAPEADGILAKTACGGVEHVPIAYETNLIRTIEALQEAGYFIIGLDERGEDIASLPAYDKTVIVMGAEGPGLRRLVKENCDILARLPMHGPMPSINVSNAAAIALYALSK